MCVRERERERVGKKKIANRIFSIQIDQCQWLSRNLWNDWKVPKKKRQTTRVRNVELKWIFRWLGIFLLIPQSSHWKLELLCGKNPIKRLSSLKSWPSVKEGDCFLSSEALLHREGTLISETSTCFDAGHYHIVISLQVVAASHFFSSPKRNIVLIFFTFCRGKQLRFMHSFEKRGRST